MPSCAARSGAVSNIVSSVRLSGARRTTRRPAGKARRKSSTADAVHVRSFPTEINQFRSPTRRPRPSPPAPSPPENHAAPEPTTYDAATLPESTAAANSISCGPESLTAAANPVEQEYPEAGAELRVAGVVLEEARIVRSPMLPYIRMVASLIEGRNIGLPELIQALQNAVRQHSISRRRRVDYVVHCLNQHPP